MMIYNSITCYLFPDIGCSKPKAYLICALLFGVILVQFITKYKNDIRNAPNYNVIDDEILKGAQPVKQFGSNTMSTKNKDGTASPLNIEHKLMHSLLDGNGTTKRLPDCIMIGVNKAGTSTLIFFLGFHPGIVHPKRELNFFQIEDRYSKGYEWYLDRLPLSRPGQITMEKTPRYFYNDNAPKRIKDMRKDIKLLVVLRDPIDRAISCYLQRMHKLKRNGLDHHFKLEDVFINSSTGEINTEEDCVNTSLYSAHFKRWLQQFPLEQFHFVDGDNLKVNPYAEIHAVEQYMDVKTWFKPAMFQFNKTKGFYCIVKPGEHHHNCMPADKGRQHPDISDHLHEKMVNFFQPYNGELEKLVGRKFGWFDKYKVS